jgi:hypothetical protein
VGVEARIRAGVESKIRLRLIEALKQGRVQHEMLDGQINTCDLLQSGQVSVEEVIEFLKPSRGLRYEEKDHTSISGLKISLFRTNAARGGLPVSWYIKCYCLPKSEEEIWFVGVYSMLKRKGP